MFTETPNAGGYCTGPNMETSHTPAPPKSTDSGSITPKFAKRYARLHEIIDGAVRSYIDEVRGGAFPGEENSY